MSIITSLLKESIKNLPEQAIKAESVVPTLLKKGVKQEELTFAGLDLPTKGKVSKQQLVEAEAGRKDKFYTTETKGFQNISLPAGKDNPTYKMKVLSFTEQGKGTVAEVPEGQLSKADWMEINNSENVELATQHGYTDDQSLGAWLDDQVIAEPDAAATSRYTSSHTDVPDYLAHTRIFDEDWDGVPVRVLQEIQSDLHQAGRQQGYDNPEVAELLERGQKLEQEFYDTGSTNRELLAETSEISEKLQTLGIEVEDELLNIELPAGGIPKSPQEKQWLRKGIERELVDAIEEGRTQLAIPISGANISDLARTPGVQKWYESQVANTAKKIAKASGSDFEMATKGNTEYAVIKPKGTPVEGGGKLDLDKPMSFSLYSSPAAMAGAAYLAYEQGATDEQVTAALEAKGFSPADIEGEMNFLIQATEQGATIQEAMKYLEGKDVNAETVESNPPPTFDQAQTKAGLTGSGDYGLPPSARSEAYGNMISQQFPMTDSELVAAMQTIYPVMSSTSLTDIPSMVGSKDAQQRYDLARQSSRIKIQELFKEKTGKDLYWEQGGSSMTESFFVQDDQGQYIEVTPGFMDSIAEESGEIIGSIVGGIATGGAGWLGGAVAGAEADYLLAAMKLQQDMEAEAVAYTALNAGELAIIGEAVSYPIVKGFGMAWRGTKDAVAKAVNGDTGGAKEALKEITFMSDDQIEEVVAQVERFTPLVGNKTEKGIQAVTMTQPGMEHVVTAASKYGKTGEMLVETIKRRTTSVLNATADLTDEQVPRMLAHDLQNYGADVRRSYNEVKIRATESPDAKNFDFDFNALAIKPVMEEVVDKIFDPTVKIKYQNHMKRVNKLTDARGFGNLIELRQLVNDFLFNKNISKADDKKLLRSALSTIDEAITDGAPNVVENPKQWLDDWAAVRSEYSQMKQVEEGALYKSVFDRKGKMRALNPEDVVKRLTKHISALDGSFENVMSKLPMAGRTKYEGAVIDHLTNKYTMEGTAIHFPQLAKELESVNFTSPDARAMKKVLTDLGETFKNDLKIVNASTGMHIPSIMQGLSDNLLVKLKYEVASKTYSKLRSVTDKTARHRVDLLQKVGNLIEAPLNQKAANELLEAADGDINIAKGVREMQQQAARTKADGQDIVSNKIHFNGHGAVKKLKGDGPVTKLPAHRITTIENARVIAEGESISLDSKQLDAVLKSHGYKAIMQGSDSIRILK